MAESITIVLVGCGNMGYSMLKGWLSDNQIDPKNIHVIEPVDVLRSRAAGTSACVYEKADTLSDSVVPDVVFIAVKPQIMSAILPVYRRFTNNAVFVSIAAGVPVSTIEKMLGHSPIIRAMPNTPASIGYGMTVTFANEYVTKQQGVLVRNLLSTMGEILAVSSETQIDAATAISGSGPAYVFHFIECLASAAETIGLTSQDALLLAKHTVSGAANMAAIRGDSPDRLRAEVTSPNGTTAAALNILMHEGALMQLVENAAKAAHNRAIELSLAK